MARDPRDYLVYKPAHRLIVPKVPETYNAKLMCWNCGLKDFYKLPYGAEFIPFLDSEDGSPRTLSHIHMGLKEDDEAPDHEKNCRNCGLPLLGLDWWETVDLSAAKESR